MTRKLRYYYQFIATTISYHFVDNLTTEILNQTIHYIVCTNCEVQAKCALYICTMMDQEKYPIIVSVGIGTLEAFRNSNSRSITMLNKHSSCKKTNVLSRKLKTIT